MPASIAKQAIRLAREATNRWAAYVHASARQLDPSDRITRNALREIGELHDAIDALAADLDASEVHR